MRSKLGNQSYCNLFLKNAYFCFFFLFSPLFAQIKPIVLIINN